MQRYKISTTTPINTITTTAVQDEVHDQDDDVVIPTAGHPILSSATGTPFSRLFLVLFRIGYEYDLGRCCVTELEKTPL